jgi:hypothetical protein
MAKPLLSSTFLSFPKLLLWGLPLIGLLAYTWLAAGPTSNYLPSFMQQAETWEHKLAHLVSTRPIFFPGSERWLGLSVNHLKQGLMSQYISDLVEFLQTNRA